MNKTHFGCFFFLLLLASQMVVQIEGWKCRTQSTMFKGICISNRICDSNCHAEGFPRGGNCKGWLRRCFCKNSSCE
ncbi:unnamed protein product [Trifolium pratense]|uniref:Uncharacterized protein n=1 Tax=Trifolium pratense TaxID=57577 RepID=A0ACB0JAX4_TRIPR|nr:unnamed protein product [Trifolium pratense]